MEVIQFNPNKNFFDQLPYDIVCHIFKFIWKDYDKKVLEINYDKFNYIINEDIYISKCRYYKIHYKYKKLKSEMLHFNHPVKELLWASKIKN